MFAHVVYRADVFLRSQNEEDPNSDNAANPFVGTKIITSATSQVQTTITGSILRVNLNEDEDNRRVFGGIEPIDPNLRDDEWVAEVRLTPHVFPTVTANSPQVVGSWGALGQD
jgi:hypothetical protein